MKGRILVVDDEPNARSALAELLREEGYAVETAADAFKALSKAEDFSPDVVLTDVKMPGMSGLELLDRLRAGNDDVVRTEVAFGEMAQEGAAGSIYYQLPVTVTLEHAEGDAQVERGCFSIRWVNPANQAEPPFQPMYIISNELKTQGGTVGFAPARCD